MSSTNRQHLDIRFSTLRSFNYRGDLDSSAKLMKEILDNKIFGLSFGPYVPGQSPLNKDKVSKEQIVKRLEILQPYTEWIRIFSSCNDNELIAETAKEMGFKVLAGAWINDDDEANQEEIANLVAIANAGNADMVAVGNEVVLRKELTAGEMCDYLNQVREKVNVPVTYVDSYYIFDDFPELVDAVDVILANCYPFWENCTIEYAVSYMREMYRRVCEISNGKKVIISETGWPDQGSTNLDVVASKENAMRYFVSTYQWAAKEDVDIIYFSSFDESWKADEEGDCGAYWGLFDEDGNYKYSI